MCINNTTEQLRSDIHKRKYIIFIISQAIRVDAIWDISKVGKWFQYYHHRNDEKQKEITNVRAATRAIKCIDAHCALCETHTRTFIQLIMKPIQQESNKIGKFHNNSY